VKAWSKPSRGGVTVKHKDIDEVFKAWDPFIFSPPAYLLHLDPRPGTNRLVDARAISRRVTIIIKTYLEDEVKGASFNPLDDGAPCPIPSAISFSPFGQGQGPSSSSTRVVFTFRNWYDVHVALRSTFTTTMRLLSSSSSGSTPTCYNLPTSAVVAATPSIQASVASASATPLPSSVAFVAPLITRSSTATTALEPARPSPAS